MAWPPHILYSFRGHLGTSAGEQLEIWSCGLRVAISSISGELASQALADDAAADWARFHVGQNLPMGTACWFDYVRLYTIGADGKATGAIYEGASPGGSVPGVATSRLPYQCAQVITLDTEGRDRPRTGRIFLPATGAIVGPNGRMTTSGAATISGATAQLVRDLNNRPGFESGYTHQVSVVSSIGAGAIKPVVGVRVGDVIDTMRTRRNALTEQYQPTPIVV